MFCEKCGNQLAPEALFCSKCGSRRNALQKKEARMVTITCEACAARIEVNIDNETARCVYCGSMIYLGDKFGKKEDQLITNTASKYPQEIKIVSEQPKILDEKIYKRERKDKLKQQRIENKIEKERVRIEQKRLAVEQERLQVEQERLTKANFRELPNINLDGETILNGAKLAAVGVAAAYKFLKKK